MPRVLSTVHLSDFQSKVLLLVHTAPTPESAAEILSHQKHGTEGNIVGAREVLLKLELIEISDSTITVTQKGEEIMRDEYLIDETGEPTEKGNELLQSEEKEITPQPPSDSEPEGMPGPMAPETAGGEQETTSGFPAENSIFRQIHDLSKLLKG